MPTADEQKVLDEYMQDFGKAPTDSEMASELENLNKYGWDTGPYGGVKAQIDKRVNNVPGDEDGDGVDDRGGMMGDFTQYPRDRGADRTDEMMNEILASLKSVNTGPDVTPDMIDPGAFPEFNVPGEDLTPAIDDTYLDLMSGSDPYGLTGRIGDLLNRTRGGSDNTGRGFGLPNSGANWGQEDMGHTVGLPGLPPGPDLSRDANAHLQSPINMDAVATTNAGAMQGAPSAPIGPSRRLLNRTEAARENLTRGSSAALADMRGVLADRGLLGSHGAPEGSELDATVRTLEPLQRAYLSEQRQSQFDESNQADQAERDALQMATGWSRDQVDRRLAAADSAQARQKVMSDTALGVLDRNMEWSKFLADFGLKREQVAEEIRKGRTESIMPILQMFQSLLTQSRGGYVGNR